MADMEHRRDRGGAGWLWWLVAIIALVLIIWWVWPDAEEAPVLDEGDAAGQVVPLAEPPEGFETEAGAVVIEDIAVVDITADPQGSLGRTLTGRAQVTEVPTDRGFWIEQNGQRLFVVLVDRPQEQPVNIQPNSTVRLTDVTVRDPSFLGQLPGAPLDADTRSIAQDQQVFLVVDEGDVQMANGTAGDTTGQTGGQNAGGAMGDG